MDLTVIVPCYNEEEVLPIFYAKVKEILARELPHIQADFLFVDDGSSDRTLKLLKAFSAKDPCCHFLSLSRNFGKEAAMYAGLKEARGNCCVLMDADLQHPPALLPAMYQAITQEGFDCCAGFRADRRGENRVRSALSKGFYRVIRRLSHLDMADGAGDFRMMSRKMVNSILSCQEYNRYMKGIFSFVGFDTKWIPFSNTARAAGKTKWKLGGLFHYALDGIFSFSTAPVTLAAGAGTLLFFLALALGFWSALNAFLLEKPVNAWTAIIFLILFLNGIQLLFISLLGEYVSRNYLESKGRPIYIVKEQG